MNAKTPIGAPVKLETDANGERSYSASAIVDGVPMRLSVTENVGGVKGNKDVNLEVGMRPQLSIDPLPKTYAAMDEADGSLVATPNHPDSHVLKGTFAAAADYVMQAFDKKLGERALASRAPAIVQMGEDAIAPHQDGQRMVSQEDFRKIRDAFKRIDAASPQASNSGLPQQPGSKGAAKF